MPGSSREISCKVKITKIFTIPIVMMYNENIKSKSEKGDCMSEEIKRCPFCEDPLVIIQDDKNNGEPYLECATCGLRFKLEGFEEKPVEIRE